MSARDDGPVAPGGAGGGAPRDPHEGGGAGGTGEARGGGNPPERVGRGIPGYRDATRGHREVPGAEVSAHEEALPEPGEHDLEPDVERIHRPIFREVRDPVEGREPAPWWVWAATALALFWGGWYLGRYGGRFGASTEFPSGRLEGLVVEAAGAEAAGAAADPVQAGMRLYATHCQSCHQQTGLGVPGVFPPLIGSEWVTGAPELPVLILLHGLQGPITVGGEGFAGAMPAWQDLLSDAEIAAIATYIRQWGTNDAPAVGPDLVAALRSATSERRTPWTVEELRAAAESPEVRGAVEGAGVGGGAGAGTGAGTGAGAGAGPPGGEP